MGARVLLTKVCEGEAFRRPGRGHASLKKS
jgi:hypothetical protein